MLLFCSCVESSMAKKWHVLEEWPAKLRSSGRPAAISTQAKWCRELHHHVEVTVDWCSGTGGIFTQGRGGMELDERLIWKTAKRPHVSLTIRHS